MKINYKLFLINLMALTVLFHTVCLADPKYTLNQYFVAVRSQDINQILNVFDKNASIVTAKGTLHGLINIRKFYLDGILKCSRFTPMPGPFYISANEIAVEITLDCDGHQMKVGDFFTITNNKIVSMRVYSGQGYKA